MAKDKNRFPNTSAPVSDPPNPPADENASAEPALDSPAASVGSEPEVALSAPVDIEIAKAHPDSLAHLIPVLPHKREVLLSLHKVHPEEFDAVLAELPEDLRKNFSGLLRRMNPVRDTREMGEAVFRPTTLRLYQGTGEKPKNVKLPKGGVEDSTGNIVLVPEAFKEDFEGVSQKIRVSFLFMSVGRAYWPARDGNGQPIIPDGLDIQGNRMICGSNDRLMGSRYGKCSDCPYKPSFDSKTKACKDSIDLFIVKPDLTGIYQVGLGATSFKTSANIMMGKANAWDADYMGQFDMSPLLVEKPGQNYYVWQATPVTSRQEPNGVMNGPGALKIMELMARQIRTEVHFPRLAAIYARSGVADATPAGSLSDIEAAAGGTDYSGGAAHGNNINA